MPIAGLLGTPSLEIAKTLQCRGARAACPDLANGGPVHDDLPFWNRTYTEVTVAVSPTGDTVYGASAGAAMRADPRRGLMLMHAFRQGEAEFSARLARRKSRHATEAVQEGQS